MRRIGVEMRAGIGNYLDWKGQRQLGEASSAQIVQGREPATVGLGLFEVFLTLPPILCDRIGVDAPRADWLRLPNRRQRAGKKLTLIHLKNITCSWTGRTTNAPRSHLSHGGWASYPFLLKKVLMSSPSASDVKGIART